MGTVAKEEMIKQNLNCRDLLDEARNYYLHLSSTAVPDFEYSIRTTPRKHTAGVLFCVGGRGGSGDPFRSIECYSVSMNSWFFGPEMNSRRRHVGVISVGALSQTEGQCQDPWRPYDNKCYYISSDVKSWPDARSDCEMRGGDLMSISSVQERTWIRTQIGVSNIYWIGLNDVVSEGVWEWSDGSPFLEELQNWRPGQPDNWQDNEDCVQFAASDSARWNDEFCTVARNYICKRLTPICPPGWIGFDSHCYWFVSNPNLLTTWSEAQGECSRLGGNLLIINSQAEQYFINGFLPDLLQSEVPDIWIGLSDQDADGTFRWVDRKDITYQNWAVSHPHNVPHLWDCGQIYTGADELNTSCTAMHQDKHFMTCDNTTLFALGFGDFTADSYQTFSNSQVMSRESGKQPTVSETWGLSVKWLEAKTSNPLQSQSTTRTIELFLCLVLDQDADGTFRWVDRKDITYQNWAVSHPHNVPHLWDCGQIYTGNVEGKWETANCFRNLGFICEMAGGQNIQPTSRPGWTQKCGYWDSDPFNDYCYLFQSLSLKTWADARRDCQNQGGDLVSITEPFEQAFIQAKISTVPTGVALWMGGHDSVSEGGWQWTDNSPFRYINWYTGNPDDYYGEDCTTVRIRDGYWNDDNCDFHRGYICKRREMRCAGPDWYEFGDFCYKPFNDKQTWFSARQKCRKIGAELVSILSQSEQSWIESYLYMATSDMWIGMNDLEMQNYFIWSDGQLVRFTYWDSGRPTNHNTYNKNCVEMLYKNGRWNDVSCSELNTYICKHSKDHYPAPSISPTVYGCQEGWEGYRYSCYWLEETPLTWSAAKTFCQSKSSTLLHILDIFEQSHFTYRLTEYSGFWWIGMRAKGNALGGVDYEWDNKAPVTFTHWDRDQPGYQWSDGSPVGFTNWGSGEPNNHQGRENCVEMGIRSNYSYWNDLNCDAVKDWICEIRKGQEPIIPPVPPPDIPAIECGTNPGWRKNNGMCYYYNDTEITDLYTAALRCYEENARLASIADEEEQSFLTSMVGTGAIEYAWIGLKEVGVVGGEYHWLDFSPVTFVNWAPGEPNDANGEEQCVQMSRHAGTWYDMNCGKTSAGYVCKKYPGDSHTAPPPTQPWSGHCPQDWLLFGNKCFLFKGRHDGKDEFHANWTFAQTWCGDQGGDLAVIDNQYENDFVASYLEDIRAPVWIGLSDVLHEGKFTWSDGSQVLYTNWNAGEPNNFGDSGLKTCKLSSQCKSKQKQNEIIRPVSFIISPFGVAEKPPPTPAPGDGMCRQGWHTYGRYCYLVVSEKKGFSWPDSRHYCQMGSAELASIHSRAEVEFLVKLNYTRYHNLWIGLTKDSSYGWAWTDKSSFGFVNWAPGEPNEIFHPGGGAEKCVEMYVQDGKWNDNNCLEKRGFICRHRQCHKPCSIPRNTHFLRHKDTRSWELLVVGFCSGGAQSYLLCVLY
ncbi:UNVERIFIED_CONTAM: hypothetical protein FKN15_023262 [Acipenser sinensis]